MSLARASSKSSKHFIEEADSIPSYDPSECSLTREDFRTEIQRELRQLAITFERQLCDTTEKLRVNIKEDYRHCQMVSAMNVSEEMQRVFRDLRNEFRNQSLAATNPNLSRQTTVSLRQSEATTNPEKPVSNPDLADTTTWSHTSDTLQVGSKSKSKEGVPLLVVDVDQINLPESEISLPGTVEDRNHQQIATTPAGAPMKLKEPNSWVTIIPDTPATGVSFEGKRAGTSGMITPARHSNRRNSATSNTTARTDSSGRPVASHSRMMISSHKSRNRNSNVSMQGTHSFNSKGSAVFTLMQARLLKLVKHSFFDYFVTFVILLNGVMVGVQTHYMAVNVSDDVPMPFQVLEYFFCVIFTGELSLRLLAYRQKFFTMSGKGWNIFDLIIVILQLVEILMEIVAAGLGFSFNLLRILRLIRVIRLARALRLIAELRTIVSSIAGSLKSLLWTGVLLFMIVYVLGVGITQHVLNKRLVWEKEKNLPPEQAHDDITLYWGDLIRSIFSLFQSITGGLDWDQPARPLIDYIGAEMGVVYTLYITFAVLAMLNVVTGIFIESVMKNASLENELRTQIHLNSLFRSLDVDHNGEISWDQFCMALDKKEMKEFFKTIDVDIGNARALFELLDLDGSESVNGDEFVDGCLKIWAPSKGLDLRMIRRDLTRITKMVEKVLPSCPVQPVTGQTREFDLASTGVSDGPFSPRGSSG